MKEDIHVFEIIKKNLVKTTSAKLWLISCLILILNVTFNLNKILTVQAYQETVTSCKL